MKQRFGFARVIPFLVLLLAYQAQAQTGAQTEDKDLPNFYKVNEHLYRGAQPTLDGIKKLATLGVKTIVNLRGEDKLAKDEARASLDAGIKYLSVPLPSYGRPRDEQVETVLGIINDPQYFPVFVHCKHGEDRTSVIIACYRILNENKTDKEVLKEAKRYGMSRFQFGMKDFIGDYYRRRSLKQQQTTAGEHSGLMLFRHLRKTGLLALT